MVYGNRNFCYPQLLSGSGAHILSDVDALNRCVAPADATLATLPAADTGMLLQRCSLRTSSMPALLSLSTSLAFGARVSGFE